MSSSVASGYIVLWVLTLFLLVLSFGVLGEVRRLRLSGTASPDRLPRNSRAPAYSTVDARSSQTVASRMLNRERHLMLFVSPGCLACSKLVKNIKDVGALLSGRLVVITKGDRKANADFLELIPGDAHVLLDNEGEIAREYGVGKFPTIVDIREGRIASYHQPRNVADIEELMRESAVRPPSVVTA